MLISNGAPRNGANLIKIVYNVFEIIDPEDWP